MTIVPPELHSVNPVPFGIITYSDAIEEQIAGLKAERDHYHELYYQAHQELSYVYDLFEVSQETLTVSHKASTLATVRYLRAHESERNEQGYIKMETWQVASMAKQDDGTLRKNWGDLSRELRIRDGQEIETDVGNVPIFDRLVVRIPTTDRARYPQGYYLETWMKERDITYHPERYRPQTPIEWGGKRKDAGRKKCPRCQVWMKAQDHIRTAQREHICPNCGTHEWDEVRRVSDDLPPTPDGPVEDAERAIASKNQVEFCFPVAEIERPEASKPVLDEVIPAPILHQDAVCSPEVESTNAPPAPASDTELLTSWLQRHIGQGQIIYATGHINADDKYLSKPAGYTPDIEAYLRGDLEHIYGSNPLYEDGSTYFLEFDFDEKQPEHDTHYKEYMTMLAAGGVASIYFPRRRGRGHFIVPFDARVEAQAAYDFVIALCPQLLTVNECFPIGDKVKQRISWPLYQRLGNIAQACRCIAMLPSGVLMRSDGIVKGRGGLVDILRDVITPASLVEAFHAAHPMEQEAPAADGGALLDKPVECCPDGDSDDMAKVVIAEMNNALSWQKAAGFDNPIRNKRFRATWRKHEHEDHTASVVIDPGDEYATDFGVRGSYRKKLDRYEVYCLTHRIDKTDDLKQRIGKRRQALRALGQQERRAS